MPSSAEEFNIYLRYSIHTISIRLLFFSWDPDSGKHVATVFVEEASSVLKFQVITLVAVYTYDYMMFI